MQPDPTSPLDLDALRSVFEGSHDPIARLNGLQLLAALAEAQRERASVIAAGELMLAECREQRDAARADAERDIDAAHEEIETLRRDLNDQTQAAFANQAEAERMRPVVEKAQRWRAWLADELDNDQAETDLAAAVDTYETQEGTDAQA